MMASGSSAGTEEPTPSPSAFPAAHPSRSFRRRLRRGLLLLAALLASLFLVRASLSSSAHIAGGSMAETLCGDHWSIRCPRCGFGYRCGTTEVPRDEQLVCPNCAHVHPLAPSAALVPGDRVGIDRWPSFLLPIARSFRRGDLIALVQPDAPRQYATKRLVGFPGETVAIRDGDVWINDVPWRKTWRELSALAVLVHDDRFRAASPAGEPPRWRPDDHAGDWRIEPTGYRFNPSDSANRDLQWLRFHPLYGHSPHVASQRDTPIRDFDPYNQNVSRTLNAVTDLVFESWVQIDAQTHLVIALNDGRESLRLRLSADRGSEIVELLDGEERSLASLPAGSVSAEHEFHLGFSQCDRQVMVAIDGREVVRHALPDDTRLRTPATRPWSIGAANGPVRLRALRLLRDIHYLAPRHPATAASRQLGADEWYVLGDNPPISVDSRDWPAGSVRSRQIYGRVQAALPRQAPK